MAAQITMYLAATGIGFGLGWYARSLMSSEPACGREALLDQAEWIGDTADDLRRIQSRLVDFAHQSPEMAVTR